MGRTRWVSLRCLLEQDGSSSSLAALAAKHGAAQKKPEAKPKEGAKPEKKPSDISMLRKIIGGKGETGSVIRTPVTSLSKQPSPPSPPTGYSPATPRGVPSSGSSEVKSGGAYQRKLLRLVGKIEPHDFRTHDAMEHDSPTLAERTRPDLPHPKKILDDFYKAYHHRDAKTTKIRHKGIGHKGAFQGELGSGHGYYAKVIEPNPRTTHIPEEMAKRHNAVYMLLSALGAHHMGTPGMETSFHGEDKMPDLPHPENWEGAQKRAKMARTHFGKKAHVQLEVGDTIPLATASSDDLERVDHEHRVMGAVIHALTTNADGHGSNVLLHRQHGHPIVIDNDGTFRTGRDQAEGSRIEGRIIRSRFLREHWKEQEERRNPSLDYRLTGGGEEIGHNYPPRVKKVLKILAHPDEKMGRATLGLRKEDAEDLQGVAAALLEHGIEGGLRKLGAAHYYRRNHRHALSPMDKNRTGPTPPKSQESSK